MTTGDQGIPYSCRRLGDQGIPYLELPLLSFSSFLSFFFFLLLELPLLSFSSFLSFFFLLLFLFLLIALSNTKRRDVGPHADASAECVRWVCRVFRTRFARGALVRFCPFILPRAAQRVEFILIRSKKSCGVRRTNNAFFLKKLAF